MSVFRLATGAAMNLAPAARAGLSSLGMAAPAQLDQVVLISPTPSIKPAQIGPVITAQIPQVEVSEQVLQEPEKTSVSSSPLATEREGSKKIRGVRVSKKDKGAAPIKRKAQASSSGRAVAARTLSVTAQDTVGNALTALVKYIPTEVITLYVAVVAARPQFEEVIPVFKPLWLYWGFVFLTPVLFALLFFNRLALTKQKLASWREYPWWKTTASTIAFGVWALAVPNSPYLQGKGEAVLAGLAALLISTFLSLLDPILEQK